MKPPRIGVMLVDDNEDDVVLTREALASVAGLELLHVAPDGAEALAWLRRTRADHRAVGPDLILMDINMPGMNGFDTLLALKHDPGLRGIPVIMLTVSDREEDVVRAYDHGASTYIRKPVAFQEFVRAMERFETYWTRVARRPALPA